MAFSTFPMQGALGLSQTLPPLGANFTNQATGLIGQGRELSQQMWLNLLQGKLTRKGQSDLAHARTRQNELGYAGLGTNALLGNEGLVPLGLDVYGASQVGRLLEPAGAASPEQWDMLEAGNWDPADINQYFPKSELGRPIEGGDFFNRLPLVSDTRLAGGLDFTDEELQLLKDRLRKGVT